MFKKSVLIDSYESLFIAYFEGWGWGCEPTSNLEICIITIILTNQITVNNGVTINEHLAGRS